eukprot:gnl/Chilomastix_cuspidata/535.p1 GENE.gnl/Chilomastix_cuspidata/535~~gnl/Chilomastix_cuspidata/535.p1  ORF type:complete len:558 (-),score=252.71 gnl/Chilomastix_cuspidata/535:681-2354(-)
MALQIPQFGLNTLLREGARHYGGLEEAVIMNINACEELSKITRSSLGPNGMNKMIVNHLEKLFVTKDAATIVSELEVQHAAARILCMAAQNQALEIGDATNLVITLGGELLSQAKELLTRGLVVPDIISGFEIAGRHALEALSKLGCHTLTDFHSVEEIKKAILPTVCAKDRDNAPVLADLAARACAMIMPEDPKDFDLEKVRVSKLVGSGLHDAKVVEGMVLLRVPSGAVREARDTKVAVFTCAVESEAPETKGTVLIKSGQDLINFSKSEEERLDAQIKTLRDAGVGVVAAGSTVSDMAQHFLDKYEIFTVRIPSKFELRRFATSVGAAPQNKFRTPAPAALGDISKIHEKEIGGRMCTVAHSGKVDSKTGTTAHIATVVLRAATRSALDDMEGAINNAVNIVKVASRDARFVPGAGATEVELALRCEELAGKTEGLVQYPINAFADALLVIPRILSETSGLNARRVVAALKVAHGAGDALAGVDIEAEKVEDAVVSVLEGSVFDSLAAKDWAIRMALDAAMTILRVDQVILAKQAGGPNPNARPKNPEFAGQGY